MRHVQLSHENCHFSLRVRLIPLQILECAERLKGEGWEYQLEASFVEVYNESLRDLLAEGRGRDVGKLPDTNVIRHHPTGPRLLIILFVHAIGK